MAVKHNFVLNVYYFTLGDMFRPLAGHHQALFKKTEPSDSIEGGELLFQLSYFKIFKDLAI